MTPRIRHDPFPHVVVNGFLTRGELSGINSGWPGPSWAGWMDYHAPRGEKRASCGSSEIPPACAFALVRAAAAPVGFWLSLPLSAPDLTLWGGGLHEMGPGGSLPPHLDADGHPRLGVLRAWSAALYVHEAWAPGDGGELLLHGPAGAVVRIDPAPGRLVAFDCRGAAWHSVAAVGPLAGQRRSLAIFGYLPEAAPGGRPRALFDAPDACDASPPRRRAPPAGPGR